MIDVRLKRTDDFDRRRFIADLSRLVSESPASDEDLKALSIKIEQQRKKHLAAMDPWERLDIDWDEYHPRARVLLNDPFYWSMVDDFSPHGNDTGSDLLADFKKWNKRHRNEPAHAMASALLRSWEISSVERSGTDENMVKELQTTDSIALDITDEAFIAVAFAAIKIRGYCDTETRELAVAAIKRERVLAALYADRWEHSSRRIETLDLLEDTLLKTPNVGA